MNIHGCRNTNRSYKPKNLTTYLINSYYNFTQFLNKNRDIDMIIHKLYKVSKWENIIFKFDTVRYKQHQLEVMSSCESRLVRVHQ